MQKTLQLHLQWIQLQCVTVDRGKNKTGKKRLVRCIMSRLDDLLLPKALFYIVFTISKHSVQKLGISCLLMPFLSMVNFIRGHVFNLIVAEFFLNKIDSVVCHLFHHTAFRWLTCT